MAFQIVSKTVKEENRANDNIQLNRGLEKEKKKAKESMEKSIQSSLG